MGQKEKLANEYIALRKEFDGDNFKPTIKSNQIWWLCKEFKIIDLKEKIEAVKAALNQKKIRLNKGVK